MADQPTDEPIPDEDDPDDTDLCVDPDDPANT